MRCPRGDGEDDGGGTIDGKKEDEIDGNADGGGGGGGDGDGDGACGDGVEAVVTGPPQMRLAAAGDVEEAGGFSRYAAGRGCGVTGTLLLALASVLLTVSVVRLDTT